VWDRLRYHVDNVMAKGTVSLVALLFAFSWLVILAAAGVAALAVIALGAFWLGGGFSGSNASGSGSASIYGEGQTATGAAGGPALVWAAASELANSAEQAEAENIQAELGEDKLGNGEEDGDSEGAEGQTNTNTVPPISDFLPSRPSIAPQEHLFDSAVYGNTSGNNGNLAGAVEGDVEIYAAAQDGIYAVAWNGQVGRQVFAKEDVHSLNYYQGMLYCYGDGAIWRIDPLSGESTLLTPVVASCIWIDGGLLYYENINDNVNLYVCDLDGGNRHKASDSNSYYRAIHDGVEYYIENDSQNLYRHPLDSQDYTLLVEGEVYWPSVYQGQLYFLYCPPSAVKYMMYRVNLDGSGLEMVTNEPVMYGNASSYGILGMLLSGDGSNPLVNLPYGGGAAATSLSTAAYSPVVAGEWIFYYDAKVDGTLWMVRPDGTENHPVG